MAFTYTMTRTLEHTMADPALTGADELRAYWVDSLTLAWPLSLLPFGMAREDVVADGRPVEGSDLRFTLVTAAQGGAAVIDGELRGADGLPEPARTRLRVAGNLTETIRSRHPNLEGYIALSLADAGGAPAMSPQEVREALTGQVALLQEVARPEGGWGMDAFTGVQTAIVLDALYAGAAAEARLGATFDGAGPRFGLWAPTAQEVALLTWETGDPTGSVPLVEGQGLRTPAIRGEDGCWTVPNEAAPITAGCQYLWEVRVYVPSTGRVEVNLVTDPYSAALTMDSTRSVALDLALPELAPHQWATTPASRAPNDASRAIYELHLRDFSVLDERVPAQMRGTYQAFTVSGSHGMSHLRELAQAGLSSVHLLPTFDIATIPESRSEQAVPRIPEAGPASTEQQAAVGSVAERDAYNWGYDPLHWMVPEGSYATDGHQDGGARIVQFRQMVGALHAAGLEVILDQVYNHTAAHGQDPLSILDRVVPGYYHRLDAVGRVTNSTCCSNIATENAMSERLMIDSVVWWARHYRIDGFRFDLMGHHSRATMERVRAALDALTLEDDGVDGASIYLYGEGWNFGEVAYNALFIQATQGQLGGTGIGTFNDRLRDAVHGGGPFDPDHRTYQGFGTGLLTQASGHDPRSRQEQAADLAHRTDLVKVALAGNLRDFRLPLSDGTVRPGGELAYNGMGAGYAADPQESVNYVDAHDNETLYDLLVLKLPQGLPMAERVRMNTVCLATTALGQSPSFWGAGVELLRSKSLDRDSYNSGDWFNAIDYSGQDNGFGRGLPAASRNESSWWVQGPLLEDERLRPSPQHIAAAKAQAMDLLRLRASTPLFWLGDAELVRTKLSFPGSGPGAPAGVITMLIDDTLGPDIDPALDGVLVVINASGTWVGQTLVEVAGRRFTLSPVQAEGADDVVRTAVFDPGSGAVGVPARTVAVFTETSAPPR
ncbi:pullulanase-type alpha-1,6-glucosidase [Actinomyces bowdenii]|uniref:pullulanase-type alpha-1,6-glucosidase n=1 Tax=Actinomyces bowdenii TaxID=131109 RepID=UPI00214CACF6|nr:pullulanase-type alpha-1,6-glucosidase [Actinomyces bowdenii]MCR2052171.1 pullulanase-type alpha-1,6-glucosidase [Actinomyces bowdenii]